MTGRTGKAAALIVAPTVCGLTGAAAAADAGVATVGTAAFYSAAATTVAAFFLFNAALKNRIGLLYAALFAEMLLLIWVLEGGFFALLPQFGERGHQFAAMVLALLGCALGFYTAGQAIDPARELKWVRRVLRDLAVLSLILLLSTWFWPFDAIALVINTLLLAMFASHLVAVMTWRKPDGRAFHLPVWTALALLIGIAGLFLLYGVDGEAMKRDFVLRWLFSVVALPAMAAIGLAVLDLRRAHDRALEDAVDAARQEAETTAALLDMERNYARARDMAAQRSRQLATATHDIRQPLAALRGELDALKGTVAAENADRLDRILDHFDMLTEELSQSDRDTPSDETAAEEIPATLLFQTLDRMFGREARASGIDLRFLPNSARFHAPAAVLMRIASNLIANAIHHAKPTRILVGVRREGDRLRLEVRDDGIGFPPPGIEAALDAGVKGEASDGSGLGLSIVRELAEQCGFDLQFSSKTDMGTRFALLTPRKINYRKKD